MLIDESELKPEIDALVNKFFDLSGDWQAASGIKKEIADLIKWSCDYHNNNTHNAELGRKGHRS